MVGDTLARAVAALRLHPTPRGHVLANWRVLAEAGEHDLDAARLAEAHLDAATITDELGGAVVEAGSLWGVWAAGSPETALHATPDGSGWYLTGRKPWCSGSDRCTHALVTATAPDGDRLFAVDLRASDEIRNGDPWRGVGMRDSGTATVRFTATRAYPVGGPGTYLDRPGFWHGAVGVAAAWFGGAVGAAAPLRDRLASGRGDEHDAAHLGRVDAALAAAAAVLREDAAEIAAPGAPTEPVARARRRAIRARASVEDAVETVLRSTGRATGPRPLAFDAHHARHVADLEVFVRQSHAERDLAALGHLASEVDGDRADGVRL
ncbi:acyl-CoA dehydrogenase [Actinomycetospora sp. TBRC 11914]|nr:acyl-CoA dehydrogenase [Actinomycetospora sp. TBRC 11914]